MFLRTYSLPNAKPLYPVCLMMALWLSSCQSATDKKQDAASASKNTQQPVAIPVVVSRVANASTNDQLTLSGATEAETTVNLGFMVAGKLNKVTIQEGQTIRAGQLIASIEPTIYIRLNWLIG